MVLDHSHLVMLVDVMLGVQGVMAEGVGFEPTEA